VFVLPLDIRRTINPTDADLANAVAQDRSKRKQMIQASTANVQKILATEKQVCEKFLSEILVQKYL
jgi:hypothetical protein